MAAFDAQLRQCTQGSDTASAIGGHNQPGVHEPRWLNGCPLVRDPVKLGGEETGEDLLSKFCFIQKFERKRSNGQLEGSFPFLGGPLPTFRGGPPARNVTK